MSALRTLLQNGAGLFRSALRATSLAQRPAATKPCASYHTQNYKVHSNMDDLSTFRWESRLQNDNLKKQQQQFKRGGFVGMNLIAMTTKNHSQFMSLGATQPCLKALSAGKCEKIATSITSEFLEKQINCLANKRKWPQAHNAELVPLQTDMIVDVTRIKGANAISAIGQHNWYHHGKAKNIDATATASQLDKPQAIRRNMRLSSKRRQERHKRCVKRARTNVKLAQRSESEVTLAQHDKPTADLSSDDRHIKAISAKVMQKRDLFYIPAFNADVINETARHFNSLSRAMTTTTEWDRKQEILGLLKSKINLATHQQLVREHIKPLRNLFDNRKRSFEEENE